MDFVFENFPSAAVTVNDNEVIVIDDDFYFVYDFCSETGIVKFSDYRYRFVRYSLEESLNILKGMLS